MPKQKKYLIGPQLRGKQSELFSYGRVLEQLINQIRKDIRKEVLPLYRQIDNNRVEDGLFGDLLVVVGKLIDKYAHLDKAVKATEQFAKQNNDSVFKTYEEFKKQNHLRIDWNPSPKTRKRLDEAIAHNVDLIKTIPQKYLTDVKKEFSKATAKGWDMQKINQVLTERHGITKRRAFHIAMDQQNKVINEVSRQVNEDAGLFSVQWVHRAGVKKPRHSHVMADGKLFDSRKGCLIDGELIQPGEKINCHCFSVVAIPSELQQKSASIVADRRPFQAKILTCRVIPECQNLMKQG